MPSTKFCFWGNIANSLEGNTIGGGELQIALIAKYIRKAGKEVVIVDTNAQKDYRTSENIEILSVKSRARNKFHAYLIQYRLLLKSKSDVYYCRIRNGKHILSYWAAKRNNAKFILGCAHDLDVKKFADRYSKFYKQRSIATFIKHLIHTEIIFNYLLKHADVVITQHQDQHQDLNKKGVDNKVIGNLLEYKSFKNLKPVKGEYYLFLGSLDKRKGIDHLNQIVTIVKEEQFKIVGGTRDKYSEILMKKIETFPNITYLGKLPHAQVLEEIKKCKAIILVSKQEGFPNVFLESWACNKPVLSLSINPGNLFGNYNIGKYFNDNLNGLIDYVDKGEITYEYTQCRLYLEEFHDPEKNINVLFELLAN